jgi:TolB-like protein
MDIAWPLNSDYFFQYIFMYQLKMLSYCILQKEKNNNMRTIFSLFLSIVLMAAQAQEKFDEILLTSGVEYIGKVTEIGEKEVKFSHKGESLVYTISKNQIFRIAFASGRTEIFSTSGGATGSDAAADKVTVNKDMIAILPFRFLSNKVYPGWEEMAYRIQEEAYVQSLANFSKYSFQPPATTNAILLKKGINPQQLRAYTMDEIANLLGVGFVMTGEVNMRSTGYTQAGTQSVYQNNNNSSIKPGGSTTSSTTTVINNNKLVESFATTVSLKIFNDKGSTLFTRSRESMWNVPDAYKATLSYLLKRTGL